ASRRTVQSFGAPRTYALIAPCNRAKCWCTEAGDFRCANLSLVLEAAYGRHTAHRVVSEPEGWSRKDKQCLSPGRLLRTFRPAGARSGPRPPGLSLPGLLWPKCRRVAAGGGNRFSPL